MLNRGMPRDFHGALQRARDLLAARLHRSKDEVNHEAEQLVLASIRMITGVQLSRMQFYEQIRDPISETILNKLNDFLEQRASGKLLQHVTGRQFFYQHEYDVSPDVLVPRPETELLIDLSIRELERSAIKPELGIEIGLGSGILSIELLSHFPNLKMIATEVSQSAAEIALKNAEKILGQGPNGMDRLQLVLIHQGDQVLEPLASVIPHSSRGKLADFLVSNPPYLATQNEVEADVYRYEPHNALFAPQDDPLFFYRKISDRMREFIKVDGSLFLEIPHERADQIRRIFESSDEATKVINDLNQRERVLYSKVREKNG